MNDSFYFFTQTCFVAVTVISYGLAFQELKHALAASSFAQDRQKKIFRRSLLGLIIWVTLISALSIAGAFSDFSALPPRIGMVFIVPLITALLITFSKTLGDLMVHIPPQNMIRLQGFRVAVEILLWLLLIQNLLPIQMTFEGRNWDVLTGISAPVFAYLFVKLRWPRTAAILWNVAGLLLLINIITIAILSFPTPLRVFMNEPANRIVAQFPFVWLPGLLVPLAYSLHFFSLRQLLTKKS